MSNQSAQNIIDGHHANGSFPASPPQPDPRALTFWRVEGSLVALGAVRPVAYFTWNSHTFAGRWARRGGALALALIRPFLYASHRVFATRVLHTLLAGVTRDRLDSLGEEYFEYVLKKQLKKEGVERLRACLTEKGSENVVLVSQGLDHVMRPLAQYLGVSRLVSNRLEFRKGVATGRLLDPVIRPRSPIARAFERSANGSVPYERLLKNLGMADHPEELRKAILPADRPKEVDHRALVVFNGRKQSEPLSVRETLAGKKILLIGVTGFIGKVWLAQILSEVPKVGKIYLLIRRQRTTTSQRRFEKIFEESPVFDPLQEQLGNRFAEFVSERVEVIEGDVSQPGLGIAPETRAQLARNLDLVVNSSGLTDFNPDLREALASNVAPVLHLIEFLRESDHAALMHLSTCYVVGGKDGRVVEEVQPNYTPLGVEDFDAEREWHSLQEVVARAEARTESPEITAALRRQALGKHRGSVEPAGPELDNLIRKNRMRWLRNRLTRAGTRRARRLGWPNTYTLSKSLAESMIVKHGAGLPIAIVRPSIVETSTDQPFRGWNEGINTSAPLSYLLGTYFRQLPTNERKCLDVIPVDMVCRGMTLIAAAIIARRHEPIYQLATSASNPCDMGRSIELTGLAHRKHYRSQQSLENWMRMQFDTIPVSKTRYEKFSVPAQKAVVRGINRFASALQMKKPPLAKAERDLVRVEKLIELYEPFILHNEQLFESQNVQLLSAALPADERKAFGYDPSSVDWWDYWINIHVPALRRWVYPLIEGRPMEVRPHRSFTLHHNEDGVQSPVNVPHASAESRTRIQN
ncbi:MAG TPA: SDR family oxidoreductase [Candidatus Acidoferrales bacterium]|nr:SDR family oxidoreductase [Candidatus Acidoferrales bacterium]